MRNYYVSGCIDVNGDVSRCDDSAAQFWTLYHRNDDGLSEGIIDCVFREDAEAAMRAYEERDALAAENVALKSAISYVCDTDNQPDYQYDGMGCGIEDRGIIDRYEAARYGWDEALERMYSEVIPCASDIETPATDAYLNSVRAEGADAVAAYHKERADALLDVDRRGANEHKVSYMAARDVAAQLRAGEPS